MKIEHVLTQLGGVLYFVSEDLSDFGIKKVSSSTIDFIGYDKESKMLFIQFKKTKGYLYKNVPADVYKRMKESESVGIFFGSEIKGKFDFAVCSSSVQVASLEELRDSFNALAEFHLLHSGKYATYRPEVFNGHPSRGTLSKIQILALEDSEDDI